MIRLAAAIAAATTLCCVARPVAAQEALDRRITLRLSSVAMRDAIDRIASTAGIRISYSGDNVPLDRSVSLEANDLRVADALSRVLSGVAVEVRGVAADHVVLAPLAPSPSTGQSMAVLDRVVVTGSVTATPARALPYSLDIVDGRDAERRGESALSGILSGNVPGIWVWDHAPASMLAAYGSIRGASSFGLSYPKVYVDGIEVANPLLVTKVWPELVERIEIIRGPQGSALYGSDALNGVVNVVSRFDTEPDGRRASVRSTIGVTQSDFGAGPTTLQEHTLSLRGGTTLRSVGVTVGGATSGDYVPSSSSRELRVVADARIIGSRSTLVATARAYGKNSGVPFNPLFAASRPYLPSDSVPQVLRTYGFGATYTRLANERWTWTLTAGADGYGLGNVSIDGVAVPSVADSALRNASGSANKGTLRASAVTVVGEGSRVRGTISFTGEQSLLHDRTLGEFVATGGSTSDMRRVDSGGWSRSGGVSVQSNLGVDDRLFFTGGLRQEWLGRTTGSAIAASLPMVGVAAVMQRGSASAKLRAAYGRSVRSVTETPIGVARQPRRALRNPALEPESQSGVEAGIDLKLGAAFTAQLTRFDQLATNLVQTVTIEDPHQPPAGSEPLPAWYQLQNVGEISNRGWESRAAVNWRHVTASATATFVDSRVRRLANGYSGDLRPGDRILGVPERTFGMTIGASRSGTALSTGVSRAYDWIGYDRLAIARDVLENRVESSTLTGATLRSYWRRYDGSLRVRASLSQQAGRGFTFFLTGENLLDRQTGEPDAAIVVPGRTISLGLKARF